ncbi:MAG: ribosome small subunit-dependent GTPase A [Fimbriimonadaceae bacterium]
MKERISQKLKNQLAELGDEQISQLYQKAKEMRKRSSDRGDSIELWIERILSKEQRLLDRATDMVEAKISGVYPKEVGVLINGVAHSAQVGTKSVIVGDSVTVGRVEDQLFVVSVQPRVTKLSRPDVQDPRKERLIVANVDVVMIVVSVVSPPLHPRLIDRYLIAVQNGGASPVICVNKLDLLEDETELEVLEPFRQIGLPVFLCSTKTGRGIQELRASVAGKMVAFVGHSGVGKSSLINAFAPELGLKTGETSAVYGRGTHTTTVSSLHQLSDGMTLVDTPGIRSFGLWEVSQTEIERSFPEIAGVTCRFNDCRHESEPGCGIQAAIEAGTISPDRFQAYMRLLEEVGVAS